MFSVAGEARREGGWDLPSLLAGDVPSQPRGFPPAPPPAQLLFTVGQEVRSSP